MDWVLVILGTQIIKKIRPVRPVFPDYLSVSYDYDITNLRLLCIYVQNSITYYMAINNINRNGNSLLVFTKPTSCQDQVTKNDALLVGIGK